MKSPRRRTQRSSTKTQGRKPGSPRRLAAPPLPVPGALWEGIFDPDDAARLRSYLSRTPDRDLEITARSFAGEWLPGCTLKLAVAKFSLASVPMAQGNEALASVSRMAKAFALWRNAKALLSKSRALLSNVTRGWEFEHGNSPTHDGVKIKGVLRILSVIAPGSAAVDWRTQHPALVRAVILGCFCDLARGTEHSTTRCDDCSSPVLPVATTEVALSLQRHFDETVAILDAVRRYSIPNRMDRAMAAWVLVDWSNHNAADLLPVVMKLADCSASQAEKARFALAKPGNPVLPASNQERA